MQTSRKKSFYVIVTNVIIVTADMNRRVLVVRSHIYPATGTNANQLIPQPMRAFHSSSRNLNEQVLKLFINYLLINAAQK